MTELIVALDTGDAALAKEWVKKIGPRVGFYKVGMELFTSVGPAIVEWLKGNGKSVFLDLKYHDIPNSAAKAVAAAARWGVDLCTVHAAGGGEMLKACRENCGTLRLLAVTVLTSLNQGELEGLGVGRSLPQQVLALATLAYKSGMHGVVCAPPDLELLADLPQGFLRVTPGVRPAGAPLADQKRTMTPAAAARNGADYIVVGRPITAAPEQGAAAANILKELENR